MLVGSLNAISASTFATILCYSAKISVILERYETCQKCAAKAIIKYLKLYTI